MTWPRPFVRWSPTALGDYVQCPRRWEWRYLARVREPDTPVTVAGRVAHQALEHAMEAPPRARTAGLAHDIARQVAADKLEDPQVAERVTTAIDTYFAMGDPSRVDIVATELRVTTTMTVADDLPPVTLVGIVDRLDALPDRVGGGLRVVDYKTGMAPDPRFRESVSRQLRLYVAALTAEGVWDIHRALALYLADATPVHVNVEDRAVTAVVDTLASVVRNVLWNARHIAAGGPDPTRGGAWTPGRFPTRPGPLCGWCPFVQRCPEGAAELVRRANRGTGKGGLRADAPARQTIPLPLVESPNGEPRGRPNP